MEIIEGLSALKTIKNAVLTQGTFDGVHIGHKGILNYLIAEAKRLHGASVLITFYPHPRLVIHPEDNNLKLLTTIAEKKERLAAIGLDYLIILPFDNTISQLSPLEYVRDLIVQKINPIKIIVGYDHRFGKNREGSVVDLEKYGETFGFNVTQINAKTVSEIAVSSTKIRQALAEGNIALANEYLDYAYTFTGRVVKGMQIGRTIGYKTANILPTDPLKRIPGKGIYAAKAIWKGEIFSGMLSIGSNPTIEGKGDSIEIHLFQFDQEIYDEVLTIELVKKIREEQKFKDLKALKNQLSQDEAACKVILKVEPKKP